MTKDDYQLAKQQHPGAILLFRRGDFYEAFYEDAQTVAHVLWLTLTSGKKGAANPVPMAGFPYYQLHDYSTRLGYFGHKTAVIGGDQ